MAMIKIMLNLPPTMLSEIDQYAEQHNMDRANTIRFLISKGLPQTGYLMQLTVTQSEAQIVDAGLQLVIDALEVDGEGCGVTCQEALKLRDKLNFIW